MPFRLSPEVLWILWIQSWYFRLQLVTLEKYNFAISQSQWVDSKSRSDRFLNESIGAVLRSSLTDLLKRSDSKEWFTYESDIAKSRTASSRRKHVCHSNTPPYIECALMKILHMKAQWQMDTYSCATAETEGALSARRTVDTHTQARAHVCMHANPGVFCFHYFQSGSDT